ncbi:hypothetical protein ALC57_03777 [Trachymyrmex cornetzi]|uniref:Uncharacterized protein n=1 Tax=Trachymyrmex cornetzi TaxID=471704 RepID=A0A151JMA1_9HYME|nr:hypothetical protein ALC57_03777 [Trachymyrmex cornetzi]
MYSSWSSRNKDPSGATIRSISMAPRNEEMEMTRHQSCIRSKLHEVYTISESKIDLNPYDGKRYVVPDSTETLPWGHWRIPL